MSAGKSIDVTILVDDAHKENLQGVAGNLEKKGFVLKESLDAVGVLTGSVPEDVSFEVLSAVPGVSAVEEERTDYTPQP